MTTTNSQGDQSRVEIVGREGLATNVGAVAQQVSSLEKSIHDQFSSLREAMGLSFDKVALNLKRIEDAEVDRQKHHNEIHNLESKALSEASKVNELWRANQNEWRAESVQRQETYQTKAEADQIEKRLGAVETFVTTSQAQFGTLRAMWAALLALILLSLAVAGFVYARIGG